MPVRVPCEDSALFAFYVLQDLNLLPLHSDGVHICNLLPDNTRMHTDDRSVFLSP
jgi:hypothetical protein